MNPLLDLASALITVFEGERLTAYQDSGGVWTIGIGHTGPDVTPDLKITHELSMALFAKDQAQLLGLVAGMPLLKAAAMASFGHNCGKHALLKVIAGEDTMSNPIHTTDRHGTVQPGLVARRRLEILLAG